MNDIDSIRADTPACDTILHFNNAGSSLMPTPVYESVINHLKLENQIGGYEAQNQATPDLNAFYAEFASLLNASSNEIAFVENATRAWDMAFYGLPLQQGDRILTHESEYSSNYLAMLQQAQRRGFHIDLIPSDEHGQINVDAIAAMVTEKTRLIAITHIPTQGGLVNPAEKVGEIAKAHNLIYLLDACQSCGQLAMDVEKIHCDVLSGTGRKFLRGPRGTGFLYVRSSFLEQIDPPFVDLFSANWTEDNAFTLIPGARRFENWESYIAGRIGLMQAVRYASNIGLAWIEDRVTRLAANLRTELALCTDIQVHDLGSTKCGIVTFAHRTIEPTELASRLLDKGINISVSTLPSARLDLGKRKLTSLARASVHYFNTDNEIDRFVETVRSL